MHKKTEKYLKWLGFNKEDREALWKIVSDNRKDIIADHDSIIDKILAASPSVGIPAGVSSDKQTDYVILYESISDHAEQFLTPEVEVARITDDVAEMFMLIVVTAFYYARQYNINIFNDNDPKLSVLSRTFDSSYFITMMDLCYMHMTSVGDEMKVDIPEIVDTIRGAIEYFSEIEHDLYPAGRYMDDTINELLYILPIAYRGIHDPELYKVHDFERIADIIYIYDRYLSNEIENLKEDYLELVPLSDLDLSDKNFLRIIESSTTFTKSQLSSLTANDVLDAVPDTEISWRGRQVSVSIRPSKIALHNLRSGSTIEMSEEGLYILNRKW